MNKATNQEQNQVFSGPGFSSGMALGTLIGIGSMYLFGTDEGRKLKQQFVHEVKEQIEEFKKSHPKDAALIKEIVNSAINDVRLSKDEVFLEVARARDRARREADKRRFIHWGKPIKKTT